MTVSEDGLACYAWRFWKTAESVIRQRRLCHEHWDESPLLQHPYGCKHAKKYDPVGFKNLFFVNVGGKKSDDQQQVGKFANHYKVFFVVAIIHRLLCVNSQGNTTFYDADVWKHYSGRYFDGWHKSYRGKWRFRGVAHSFRPRRAAASLRYLTRFANHAI